jgi:hypothetical protein
VSHEKFYFHEGVYVRVSSDPRSRMVTLRLRIGPEERLRVHPLPQSNQRKGSRAPLTSKVRRQESMSSSESSDA